MHRGIPAAQTLNTDTGAAGAIPHSDCTFPITLSAADKMRHNDRSSAIFPRNANHSGFDRKKSKKKKRKKKEEQEISIYLTADKSFADTTFEARL